MCLTSRQQFTDLNEVKLELQLEGFKAELLYWGFFDGSEWWRNYLHIHSFFEVCYVLEGEGDFQVEDQLFRVKQGDLFIAKPDERHEIISSKRRPLAIYFWSYTLVPPSDIKRNELNTLFNAFRVSKEHVAESQEAVARILGSLTDEIRRKAIGYRPVIESLVKQLLIETARASTQVQSLQSYSVNHTHQDRVVGTIIQYLRDNYAQPLTLKKVAAQVHLSERHMSRMFKKATGQTIKHYVTTLRMNVAKQRLLNSGVSVSNVAYDTGYQDVRHFSTVFRKWVGLSPSQYRARGGTEFLS